MTFRLLRFQTTAAVVAVAALAACSKKSDDAAPTRTNSMSWTVDGGNVTAPTIVAISFNGQVSIVGSTNIGAASSGNILQLSVAPQVGTYAIDNSSTAATPTRAYYQTGTGQTYYSAAQGDIVITNYTPSTTAGASNLVGTFSFTSRELNNASTKAISNGKFNVYF